MTLLVSGTPDGLSNTSPPVTGLPFCCGCWCRSTGGSNAFAVSLGNSGVARRHMGGIGIVSSKFAANVDDGVAFQTVDSGIVVTNPAIWTYLIGNFVSTTSRSLHVWQPDVGTFTFVSGTTAVNVAAANRFVVGFRADTTAQSWIGTISDAWWADGVFPGGVQSGGNIPQALVKQIAQHGPLSYPPLAANLIDFLPLASVTSPKGQVMGTSFANFAGWTGRGKYGISQYSKVGSPTDFGTAYESSPYRDRQIALLGYANTLIAKMNGAVGIPASTAAFRKTLSSIGSRVGSRQVHRV